METVQKPHSNHLRTISMLLLVFYLAVAHSVTNFEPDHLTDEHSALLRSKRRVEEVSSSAIEYMKNLRDRLSDKEGKPTFSNSDDPTEVWAIQDRGEANCMHGCTIVQQSKLVLTKLYQC